MRARNEDASAARRIRAEALRDAARIAESEESLLAVDYWNCACRRISERLEAEAARVEAEVLDRPISSERTFQHAHRFRAPAARCSRRRSF